MMVPGQATRLPDTLVIIDVSIKKGGNKFHVLAMPVLIPRSREIRKLVREVRIHYVIQNRIRTL